MALLAVILATLAFFLLFRLRADLVAEVDKGSTPRRPGSWPTPTAAPPGCRGRLAGLSRGATVAQLLSSAGQVQYRAGTGGDRPVPPHPGDAAAGAGRPPGAAEMRPGADRTRYRVLALRRTSRTCWRSRPH